jgi:histidyl-tRNA synthetase
MDIWGEADVTAEAELLSAISTLLDRLDLGSDRVKIRVNSRALLEETLRAGVLRGRPEIFEPLCIIIDKLDKIGADAVRDLLCAKDGAVGLSTNEANQVIALLQVRDLDEARKQAPDDSGALASLERLFGLLDAYGIRDRVVFDASVVRGLAYYTGIVFEVYDTAGQLRAICGGGRYDGLAERLGGRPISAVGFGFGDAVIVELLKDLDRLPELPHHVDDVVYALGEEQRADAIAVARRLRGAERRVELVLGTPKLKRVLGDADRNGVDRVWIIGPEEAGRGNVRVRDLATGEEHEEPIGGR